MKTVPVPLHPFNRWKANWVLYVKKKVMERHTKTPQVSAQRTRYRPRAVSTTSRWRSWAKAGTVTWESDFPPTVWTSTDFQDGTSTRTAITGTTVTASVRQEPASHTDRPSPPTTLLDAALISSITQRFTPRTVITSGSPSQTYRWGHKNLFILGRTLKSFFLYFSWCETIFF